MTGKTIVRKLSLSLVASIFTFGVCFLVTEVTFRVYAHLHNIDFRLYQKELKNSDRLPTELFVDGALKPGAEALATTSDFSVLYRLNSFGYRAQEHSLEKQNQKKRVLVFGDSFTFGEGVPDGERYTDVLAQKYPAIEVINLGVPGSGIDEEYARYHQFGSFLQPDYVIIAANWLDAERYSSDIVKDGVVDSSGFNRQSPKTTFHSDVIERNNPNLDFELPLSKRSYFLSYLGYHISIRKMKQDMKAFDASLWTGVTTEREREKELTEVKAIEDRTALILEAFKRDVEAQGGKFILVNIDSGTLQNIADKIPNVTYFDYSQKLTELSEKQPLTFTYDRHYNPKTHQQLGVWLSEDFGKFLETSSKTSN